MDDVQRAKVWQVTVGGKSVKVEALPLRDVDRIAKQADTTWFSVVSSPLLDLLVSAELVDAAAAYLGVESPGDSLSPRTVVEMFELVDDDVPEGDAQVDADPLDPSGDQNVTPG